MNEFKSNTTKISIAVKSSSDNMIEEVAVVLMDGVKAVRIAMISPNYDELDETIGSKIMREETDSRFVDEDEVEIQIRNIMGNDAIIQEICDILEEYSETEDLPPIDYVIYIDKLDTEFQLEGFKDDLYDAVEAINSDLVPTFFQDIFPSYYIEDILVRNKMNHSYTKDSALSAAIWSSLVFDILSSGK